MLNSSIVKLEGPVHFNTNKKSECTGYVVPENGRRTLVTNYSASNQPQTEAGRPVRMKLAGVKLKRGMVPISAHYFCLSLGQPGRHHTTSHSASEHTLIDQKDQL